MNRISKRVDMVKEWANELEDWIKKFSHRIVEENKKLKCNSYMVGQIQICLYLHNKVQEGV